jgi:hypothetical protein
MKSINQLGFAPASLPLSPDNVVEFHAARLLLLISLCGTGGRIDGLTKMAKLDFFVRYPDFFAVAKKDAVRSSESEESVESAMVRHHYGPWDKRYYHVLAYLEAKQLISIAKKKSSFQRGGPGCLNRLSASISGASAGVRPPCGLAAR